MFNGQADGAASKSHTGQADGWPTRYRLILMLPARSMIPDLQSTGMRNEPTRQPVSEENREQRSKTIAQPGTEYTLRERAERSPVGSLCTTSPYFFGPRVLLHRRPGLKGEGSNDRLSIAEAHDLRYGVAMKILSQRPDLGQVRVVLGPTRIDTTQIYKMIRRYHL
jgi:hypothetical protein